MANSPQGYRPTPKYIALQPFFPIVENVLFASAAGYTKFSPDPIMDASAKNDKALFRGAPTSGSTDIQSAFTALDSNSPQQGPWLNPLVNLRETQNAGNLPNPVGLDNLGKYPF